jgi:hypothetical protein
MRTSVRKPLVHIALAVVAAGMSVAFASQQVGCSSSGASHAGPAGPAPVAANPGASEQTGSVGITLTLPGGARVDAITWVITGPNGGSTLVQQGTVNVQNSTSIGFLVGGIAPGTNYGVALSGTSVDGMVTCAGSATFGIASRTTTNVTVLLQCNSAASEAGSALINASPYNCAALASVTAMPLETTVGNSVALTATATGPNTGGLTYAWSATGGAFSAPNSAATTFTCAVRGPVTVTVSVSDGAVPEGGACPAVNTATVQVQCDVSSCTSDSDCASGHCVANVGGGSTCCPTACVPSDACHIAQCSNGVCTNLPKAQCGFAACQVPGGGCGTAAPDSDGDGLSDVWENNGYVDNNCDGVQDTGDVPLPGADPHVPDIYVSYDWMDWSIPGNRCNTDADCTALGPGHAGETCDVSIHQCKFDCTADSQCTGRSGMGHQSELCKELFWPPLPVSSGGVDQGIKVCEHTHDPAVVAPDALAAVVSAFAARGYHLHLTAGSAKPHSLVTSFRTDAAMNLNGAGLTCEGATGADVGIGQYAVSLYDVKNLAPAISDARRLFYHYALFGHYNTCDSQSDCATCPVALNPDGSAKTGPVPGETGRAELSGNDFVISLGGTFQDQGSTPTVYNVGGTFMHELGHNLGMHHGGGIDTPCASAADCPSGVACTTTPVGKYCLQSEETNWKPNYMSVMNYRYQQTGIQYGADAGSSVPVGARLDYSTELLPTGGNTPGFLDQSITIAVPTPGDPGLGLNEPAGLGATINTTDVFTFTNAMGVASFGPAVGPVSWSGSTTTQTHVQADTTCGVDHSCSAPVYAELRGHVDWAPTWVDPSSTQFTYMFQCTPFFADGTSPPEGITP